MATILRLVTAGNHDPAGPPEHENNVWIVGDDAEVILIDPAHSPDEIVGAVAGRQVVDILLTHGHWDHVRAAVEVASRVGATVWLNPADRFLWKQEHTEAFTPLTDGQQFSVADVALTARFTPGHTPGSTVFLAPELGAVFSGDTLFEGGPGATRWEYSSFEQIIGSITEHLLSLPDNTQVHTGHGPSTTVGAERPQREAWIARGW